MHARAYHGLGFMNLLLSLTLGIKLEKKGRKTPMKKKRTFPIFFGARALRGAFYPSWVYHARKWIYF